MTKVQGTKKLEISKQKKKKKQTRYISFTVYKNQLKVINDLIVRLQRRNDSNKLEMMLQDIGMGKNVMDKTSKVQETKTRDRHLTWLLQLFVMAPS